MGEWSYAALQPREKSIADAFAEGAVWSPDYYSDWCARRLDAANEVVATEPSDIPIDAVFVRKLILGQMKCDGGVCLIDETGARISDAKIAGDLDLTAADLPKPLKFERCRFDGDVILNDAKLGHVSFLSCTLKKCISADSVRIDSDFLFEKSQCQALRFKSARISGSVSLEHSALTGDPTDLDHRTVDFSDAKIDSYLSIRWSEVTGEVRLVGITVTTNVMCSGAKLTAVGAKKRALYCRFGTIKGGVYIADGFSAKGAVRFESMTIGCNVEGNRTTPKLDRVRIEGLLSFSGSEIGGSLHLEEAVLIGLSMTDDERLPPQALSCWNTSISANVFLCDADIIGEADFNMAEIHSSFRAERAKFSNPAAKALNCESATIGFSVFLDGATAEGRVDFVHAKIGGRVTCAGGTFDYAEYRKDKPRALNFDGAKIGGGVFLDLIPKEEIKGAQTDKLFSARGAVYFHGAQIGGDLVCRGGRFINLGDAALVLSAAEIDGSVYLSRGFLSVGEVYCRSLKVAGNFRCRGGSFHDGLTDASSPREREARDAIDLEGARIGGGLFLTGILRFRGRMDLQGASAKTFADDTSVWRLNWSDKFKQEPEKFPDENAVWLPNDLSKAFKINEKDLRGRQGVYPTRRSKLRRRRWGASKVRYDFNCIQLDRFVFDAFANDDRVADDTGKPDGEGGVDTDLSWEARYALLQQQPEKWLGKEFRPQPFTQCAKVLRSMGNKNNALNILYHRECGRLRHEKVWKLECFIRRLMLGLFAGYGYRARRAFGAMVFFWAVGVCIFSGAYINGQVKVASETVLASTVYVGSTPYSPPPDYEKFMPVIYSLDVMVPIIDLHQKHTWILRHGDETKGPEKHLHELPDIGLLGMSVDRVEPFLAWVWCWRWLPKAYYWFEIIMGWFLSTVLLASLSGLIGNPRED